MKKKIIIFLMLVIVMLSGCAANDLNSYISKMSKSMSSVKTAEVTFTVTDSDVVVYEYQQTVNCDDKTIETSISQLNSSFVLATSTETTTVEEINRSGLLNIDLQEQSVSAYAIGENNIVATISSENIASLLKVESLAVEGDATLTLVYANDKIVTITCEFTTSSNKKVVMTTEYSY